MKTVWLDTQEQKLLGQLSTDWEALVMFQHLSFVLQDGHDQTETTKRIQIIIETMRF